MSSQLIALNIAGGNGKRSPADRGRFFVVARGSAMECAATLDVLAAVGAFPLDEITPGKALLFPVVNMLSKISEYPEVAREEVVGTEARMRLGMDNKSKSKNLDCEYVYEKVRKNRMSPKVDSYNKKLCGQCPRCLISTYSLRKAYKKQEVLILIARRAYISKPRVAVLRYPGDRASQSTLYPERVS